MRALLERRAVEAPDDRVSLMTALERYRGRKNIFVSFRTAEAGAEAPPRVGINPRSRYDTPNGVYAYPVSEILSLSPGESVPFGGDRYFAAVLQSRPGLNYLVLDRLTEAGYEQQVSRLLAHPDTQAVLNAAVERHTSPQDHPWRPSPRGIIDSWAEQANDPSPGGRLWNVTRELAGRNRHRWNRVLREICGYAGVMDLTGAGIIHSAEPTQAVFLSSSAFAVVDILRNRPVSYKERLTALGLSDRERTQGFAENEIVAICRDQTVPEKLVLASLWSLSSSFVRRSFLFGLAYHSLRRGKGGVLLGHADFESEANRAARIFRAWFSRALAPAPQGVPAIEDLRGVATEVVIPLLLHTLQEEDSPRERHLLRQLLLVLQEIAAAVGEPSAGQIVQRVIPVLQQTGSLSPAGVEPILYALEGRGITLSWTDAFLTPLLPYLADPQQLQRSRFSIDQEITAAIRFDLLLGCPESRAMLDAALAQKQHQPAQGG